MISVITLVFLIFLFCLAWIKRLHLLSVLNDRTYGTSISLQLPSEEEPMSPDYEVLINGIKAIVYVARVQDPL